MKIGAPGHHEWRETASVMVVGLDKDDEPLWAMPAWVTQMDLDARLNEPMRMTLELVPRDGLRGAPL